MSTKNEPTALGSAATAAAGTAVPISGLETARFDCVYPGCGGVCCINGRPPVEPGEQRRIQENLAKFLPHMRPEARERVLAKGCTTRRIKEGLPTLAVVDDWCVFHNDGCVLHKVGAQEGDRWKYKPWRCIVFPLERSPAGKWHVRQWGVKGEAWDVFCLDPGASPKKARETLPAEIAFVQELESGRQDWRLGKEPGG